MFAAGGEKLGWFNAFIIFMLNRKVRRWRYLKSFSAAKSRLRTGDPYRTFNPELLHRPNWTGLLQTGFVAGQPGTANAVGSNAWLTVPFEMLPLPMWSGITPMAPAPEGSKPENVGV